MISRRELLAVCSALPLRAEEPKLNVVIAGGHPDDPESGAGGTAARYSGAGHRVTLLYLTRGEAGIAGRPPAEAAAIRTREAEAASKILGARTRFAGQIDGATEVNAARYQTFGKLLSEESPDVLFTHWPIDTHRDHRAASLLVFDYWRSLTKKPALYYYEVMTGNQTQDFHPTDYVDITPVEARKREACFAHASQNPADFYAHHLRMQEFRGLERRVKYAEAFVRHSAGPAAVLPGGPTAR